MLTHFRLLNIALFAALLPRPATAQTLVAPATNALGKALSVAKEGEVIYLKNGRYRLGSSNLPLHVTKKNITIIGESRDSVVITGSRYQGQTLNSVTLDAEGASTMLVMADDFYAENLTIENTATQAQAQALLCDGDRLTLNSCRLRGFQDTYYARQTGKRHYVLNGETSGDVDFIYGGATLVHEACSIVSRSRKAGYIAAPNAGGRLVFLRCSLVAEEGLADSSCYLGRPWGAGAAAFVECKMGGHIKPEGWAEWNVTNPQFDEYLSTDLQGAALNVSQRSPLGHQLSAAEAEQYAAAAMFGEWNHREIIDEPLLPAPSGMGVAGDSLRWTAVGSARGYLVYRNDSLLAYTAAPAFSIREQPDVPHSLRTVNRYGRPGEMSQLITAAPSAHALSAKPSIYAVGRTLYAPQNERVEVYSILGTLMLTRLGEQQVGLDHLPAGIYMVRVVLDKNGSVASQKIMLK
ncbi:MAG: T9SS type A sorting domain-containing protein [Prevotellaceae bacterium]|jgi:pectinesterase|nr:T9SS type A sorting domain-containing protein [Prevotellaceae bacterium]